jgi:hypothetical protein
MPILVIRYLPLECVRAVSPSCLHQAQPACRSSATPVERALTSFTRLQLLMWEVDDCAGRFSPG